MSPLRKCCAHDLSAALGGTTAEVRVSFLALIKWFLVPLFAKFFKTLIIMSDWDTVTIIGSKARVGGGGPRQTVARTAGELNAARRAGAVVGTEKKYGSTNTKSNPEGQRLTKLDATDDVVPTKKLDPAVGRAIQLARAEKKLTQKDLATKINEKPQVINDYEAGRALPNQQLLGKMERALGVKLRGKNIGEPLFAKKS
jgi:putative transcription factor